MAGGTTPRFLATQCANLVAERRADSSVPEVGGVITDGTETIGGVTLHYRLVADTEAPEMLLVELPQAGALIVQDLFYNRVHAVVSRTLSS